MIKDLGELFSLFDRHEKLNFGLQIFLMVVSSLFEVVGIGVIPLFLIVLSSPEKLQRYTWIYATLKGLGFLESKGNLLLVGTISLGFFFLLKNLFLFFVSYFNSKFLLNYKLKLEKRLYTAYINAPYLFHLSANSSGLLSNLSGEIRVVVYNVLMSLFKVINFGVLTVSIVTLLVLTEPIISIVIFLLLGGVILLFLYKIRKKTREFGQEEQKQRGITMKWINQSFGGLKDIRILNKESYFASRFFDSVEKTAKASLYNQVVSNIPKPLVETVSVFAMLGIIFFLLSNGETIGSIVSVLVLFGAALIRLMPASQSLASNYSSLKYSTPAIKPIYRDISTLLNSKRELDDVSPLRFDSMISIKDVSFSYPGGPRPVLRDITLEIKAGESIAFVGASGSGKTTLVDIIMGLLVPATGKIVVDNVDILDNPTRWFRNIGYVPQSIYLIDDTVRRNIALGIEDDAIDEERIQAVIEEAQISDFVNEMPEGLDTQIGERGVRISGGQRQRLGIARALYHDPQVLVLDEATSALDNVVERYIIQAIERFKRRRTVIMIAHRLSTVMACDSLYFMDRGHIVNKGTFNELVENDPEFRKISQA